MASIVPSPPSAMGMRIQSAVGIACWTPAAIAAATSCAEQLSLKESGAITIRGDAGLGMTVDTGGFDTRQCRNRAFLYNLSGCWFSMGTARIRVNDSRRPARYIVSVFVT